MRRLTLCKDTLGELTADELREVAGAYPTQQSTLDCLLGPLPDTSKCPTLPVHGCLITS
ncbi:MAG TPA: hypothetical protein VFQ85_13630 [Mycobacteriales bacterium]|jgi:hypothetical protein|nr:hypothetical protein [Mycobacteriales bacterium]